MRVLRIAQLVAWLVGLLAGWLAGWLVSWMVDWVQDYRGMSPPPARRHLTEVASPTLNHNGRTCHRLD